MKRSISIFAALGALSLAAPAAAQTAQIAPATPAQKPGSDPERVRDLLTRGTEALSANRHEEARSLLSEAFRLKRSYDVAAALGQSELELGKYRDSAEHFEYAIREFPPGESRKLLKQLESGFATSKARVAALHISVNQAGSEVSVDGAVVGTSPLPGDIFVEPGQHTLGARLGAGSAVERVVVVAAGKDYPVELQLTPKAAAPVSPADASASSVANVPPKNDSAVSAKTITLIGGGALTAVLLGVGIAERVRASNADNDAADLRDQLSGSCSPESADPVCQELIETLDRRNTANQIAIYTFAGAGLAAAATAAIWLLWEEPRSTAKRSLLRPARRAFSSPKVLVDVAPQRASVSIATTF